MTMIDQEPLRTVDEKIAQRTTDIAERIDPAKTQSLTAGAEFGGVRIENMLQVMEMAKLMAVSQQAVPAHLRANPGMCLAVCLQAVEWRMSPFSVANKSYVTNDRLNYESQLVHAVIEARAPLRERLKVRYEGEGEDTVCIVSGIFRGEAEPREHRSPPLKHCRPPTNDRGIVKGSPLWTKKPLVQMFYDTSRDWIRIYAPDVILGIYTPDELEQYDVGADAVPVGGTLADRLKAKGADHATEGFRDGVVEAGLNGDLDHAQTAPEGATEAAVGAAQAETGAKSRRRATAKPAKDVGPSEGEAKASEAAQTTPVPEERQARTEPFQLPTNLKSYTEWLKGWLGNLDEADDIANRWFAEKKLRNACGITADDREPLERLKAKRIAELKG